MFKLEASRWVEIYYFGRRNSGVFLISLLIFSISFFGTIVALQFVAIDSTPSNFKNPVPLRELGEAQGLNWISIFQNNFIVLLPVILGVFTLGLISVVYIVFQGFLLGLTVYEYSLQIPPLVIMKYTIPHGVFEILAIVLAGAFSLKPVVVVINHILFKKPFLNKNDLRDMGVLFTLYICFLLGAALIEGLITTRL